MPTELRAGIVIKIGNEYYKLIRKDSGFLHPEDRGLWLAWKVRWDEDHFGGHDDDDWMITEDGKEIIAREVGWDRKRFKPGDWGYSNYMIWR